MQLTLISFPDYLLLVFHRKFGRNPTLKEIQTVYEFPEDENSDEYQMKNEIFLWYFDEYLVACTGKKLYGPDVRYYTRAIKTIQRDGKNALVVPLKAEALGMAMFENCEDKWKEICPKKAKDPNWRIPTYSKKNTSTHKYNKTKWTDPAAAKERGGGWSDEGYAAFNQYMKLIQQIRKKDKENGWRMYNLGLEMMRDKHGITATSATETAASKKKKSSSKKRKADVAALEAATEYEDVDDEYSDHSDSPEEPETEENTNDE